MQTFEGLVLEVIFKTIITLPPFISKVFLDLSLIASKELGFLTVLVEKAFLVKIQEAVNHDKIKNKLGDLLSFLRAIYQNKIVLVAYTLSSKKKITVWLKAIYESCICSSSVLVR